MRQKISDSKRHFRLIWCLREALDCNKAQSMSDGDQLVLRGRKYSAATPCRRPWSTRHRVVVEVGDVDVAGGGARLWSPDRPQLREVVEEIGIPLDFLVQRHHDAWLRRIRWFLVRRLKTGRNRF
jgi:hypothetical protein